eukprot:TRINITY_DN146_c0_g1_i7.p1 TRINITY_DN146_c0_g1~~TRINITY_DN146_c0_g1_i7.p1  ORF type:complete len:131 (-),score=15.83 TRINITY_DN146_c0_g1_i7:1057-1449(-)
MTPGSLAVVLMMKEMGIHNSDKQLQVNMDGMFKITVNTEFPCILLGFTDPSKVGDWWHWRSRLARVLQTLHWFLPAGKLHLPRSAFHGDTGELMGDGSAALTAAHNDVYGASVLRRFVCQWNLRRSSSKT